MDKGTDTATRARFINGLRDLAAFLDTHLFFPVPPYGAVIDIFPEGQTDDERRTGVDKLAAILGVTAHDDNGHYTATASFGPLAYEAVAISDAARAAHRARTSYFACIQPDDTAPLGDAA